MIESLISALGLELGLTSKEIADVVWLALQMNEVDRPPEQVPDRPEKVQSLPQAQSTVEPPFLPSERRERSESKPSEPQAGLYAPDYQDSASMAGALALKVPDARSMREPLSLARALKPLLRKVMTGYRMVLDETATVERIAEEGVWLPVLQPSLEPWLELALVVDESVSMQIWRRTIVELQRFMEHYGVFRDVRVWGLLTDEQGQVQIRPGMGKAAMRQGLRRPSELIDPSGRRLILVATDCVSPLWRDGTIQPALKLWSSSGPMAIVQMLPEWLWARTGLGLASTVRYQSRAAGLANQQLRVRDLSPWDDVDVETGVKVPVVTLEPERFSAWTEMMTGKGGTWATGVIFEPGASEASLPLRSDEALDGEQRVQQFRVTASPMARQLAGLLAAAPVINLPIVRIIQERLLKESRQVHVAEVFLGGLLKPLVEITPETNVDSVQYEFLDGVRDVLLESMRTSETINVLNEVSQFVAERLGLSIDAFMAVLRSPQQLENQDLAANVVPFAVITAQILRGLGGEYTEFSQELQERLRQHQQSNITYLYEVKLIIVGAGGSGKTNLANKLINPDYDLRLETEDISTEGINILDWEFIGTNGKDYKIHIWDFGGQEIYHQTHQFFLTDRACYLLVVDDRKENTDHYYWLQTIQLLGKDSPIHLIQNERGDRACNININKLRGEFANLRATHRVNLQVNRGLESLKLALQQQLETTLTHGIPFPNKWLNVRHTLENDSRNYIDTTDYEATCRRHDITEKSEMATLSRFLHDLGILLHFQNDPILRHRLILKPNWGTAAVYKILDNDRIKTHLGQFTDLDLAEIWSDRTYADMHHELLQLMKEFKVCYEIPRRPGHYIAPHLLNPEAPDYDWNPTSNLILRYRYNHFMPKGLLTRFIVEQHRSIENINEPDRAHVWKNGVIITNRSARAEIIEYYPKREIRIRVSGNRPRDLFTIINHQFEDIHDHFYKDPNPDKPPYDLLIPCNCPTCKPSATPFTFTLDRLYTCLDRNRYTIECHESGEDVIVRSLIDGVIQDDPEDFEDSLKNYLGKRDRRGVSRRRINSTSATPTTNIYNTSQHEQDMSNDMIWNDDRVPGKKNQINIVQEEAIEGNEIVNSKNLPQAAKEIKDLLDEISAADTTNNQTLIAMKAIEAIEQNPTLKQRIINAGKEAGFAAIDAAVEHPVVKIVMAGIRGLSGLE